MSQPKRHSLSPEESEFRLLQECAAPQTQLAMAQGRDLLRQFQAARRLLQRITQRSQSQVDEDIQKEMDRR